VASNPVYLEIVDFKPSPGAQKRAPEWLELAKQDQLTPEQASELEHFTELEHILRIAKARARQILAAAQQ